MQVHIPSPMRSYTGGSSEVQAEGPSVAALLLDLDRRFPGFRFRIIDEQDRIRPHMRIFVNGEQTFELETPLRPSDDVHILQALSGG
ncbi:MAG: MoaD/ThiS family protein [Candidatus Eisenbacteria bacterium]|nr:MoaD/ThiS family protein [Candidatus Eisenbacteria bacterium]